MLACVRVSNRLKKKTVITAKFSINDGLRSAVAVGSNIPPAK